MKKALLIKLLLLAMIAVSLSGCIVIPAWDGDDWGHHHGDYHYRHY